MANKKKKIKGEVFLPENLTTDSPFYQYRGMPMSRVRSINQFVCYGMKRIHPRNSIQGFNVGVMCHRDANEVNIFHPAITQCDGKTSTFFLIA